MTQFKSIDLVGNKKLVPYIVIVGLGGNGGYILQHVAQMMSIFSLQGEVLCADSDIVEEKNLGNQLFIKDDIGKPKAQVLAKRYSNSKAYNIPIRSYTASYVETIEQLDALFSNTFELKMKNNNSNQIILPILIGAVDNNYTRVLFHKYFELKENLMYIDVGNHATTVPADWRERDKQFWSKEELEKYRRSGWQGQAVCALKMEGEVITEPVGHFFPNILDVSNEKAPSEVSCSELAASNPQRVLTNKYSAMAVSTFINELFDEGTLTNHIIMYHVKKGFMKASGIPGNK
ncbi:ThiF family adenylyltransferase [Bacillus mycoides]|uniref:ThiF family adenylyltransferase n=1 Tax=Bacillus mycoides TaxID=1405 RepID=UPI0010BE3AEE|nr:ThiF family adenylyltransferase [Bacillus mycoides]TKI38694.1 thiamine biosynthesis protein ThiF [Bacillus mycoides]